jgi:hypothetical protein
MSPRRAQCLALVAVLAPMASTSQAQQPGPPAGLAPPQVLTPELRGAVVDSVAAHLTRFYAVADTGRLIAEHLQRRSRAGAYSTITSPARFAEVLSTDLKAINGDRHLSVALAGPSTPAFPPGITSMPGMNFGSTPPQGSPPPAVVAAERRSHFNLGRVDVLPGNVGYMEMRGFSNAPEARDAVVAALRYVEHTDAMILDVRNHSGGSAILSNFVISHFTGPDSVHALDVAIRAANQKVSRWTLTNVPGPRRPDVPLYVLTSRGTVSAGEDLAFVLKNLGRATLIGEPTNGAGRNNPSFHTGLGFVTSVSVSTVKDPRTGAEWEGVGVKPDVAVPPRTALVAAHAHALRTLAERADSPARRRELELTREFVEAQARPRQVPAAVLQRYVGTYGGERTITVENGRLVFRRTPDRLGQELTPLSDTLFAVSPVARIAFERDGAGSYRMRAPAPFGESLLLPRSGPAPAIRSEDR